MTRSGCCFASWRECGLRLGQEAGQKFDRGGPVRTSQAGQKGSAPNSLSGRRRFPEPSGITRRRKAHRQGRRRARLPAAFGSRPGIRPGGPPSAPGSANTDRSVDRGRKASDYVGCIERCKTDRAFGALRGNQGRLFFETCSWKKRTSRDAIKPGRGRRPHAAGRSLGACAAQTRVGRPGLEVVDAGAHYPPMRNFRSG